ncbi:hypothetical protein GCM10027340_12550 [Marinomonas epiphytica]
MQILVDLAQRKEDAVASQLARDRSKVAESKQKLAELKEYAAQYESERNLLGLSAYLTTNYQHFVNRVQQAVMQQEQAVGRAEQQAEMTMRRWLEARSQTQSMDWLKDKKVKIEQVADEKLEQKQSDEFAMRRYLDANL